jgi:hypothetical protein
VEEISATERGTQVLRESHRRMVQAFERPLASWPEDDIVALAARLDRLREDFADPAAQNPQEAPAQ